MYSLQNWYSLSDPMFEEMLYDSEARRHFMGITLGNDRIPDKAAILYCRQLLVPLVERKAVCGEDTHLTDQGITLRLGTLMNTTIVDAACATVNKANALDPEMSSTNKANNWYLAVKAHVGVDALSEIVYNLETTTTKT
ncbi:MAG: transposase [Rhodobacteraceae bacterium]|uniref:transposase n=1 Tax=Marivita sp. TaxID=2003365 RepID=UPI003B519346|nr:transposase [Paracoccaceae bacterium]